MDMSKYAEPLPTEIEQIVDEARADVGQGPAKRTPAEGIADMEARIQYHTNLIRQAAATYDLLGREKFDALEAESQHQINLAKARLREYQLQQQGQN